MLRHIVCAGLTALVLAVLPAPAAGQAPPPDGAVAVTTGSLRHSSSALREEAALDWHCLQAAYPQLRRMEADGQGRLWLHLADGQRVLYAAGQPAPPPRHPHGPEWDVDVRSSMRQLYVPDPERPPTPAGQSPGRRRSYALLQALYGSTARETASRVRRVSFFRQTLLLEEHAARALQRVEARLAPLVAARPALRRYLKQSGGFVWRAIAGEQRLSPHAFGIALDLSPRLAPYWRWSALRPHPLQASYPTEIVTAFEAEGFIWGGKWHEYDIMHFEYRPELLCKSRLLLRRQQEARATPASGPAPSPRP